MIRHLVMFRLKEFGDKAEKLKAAEAVRAELLGLKKKIPVILESEIGINLTDDPSAFDVVINFVFQDLDDLEKYRVHPDHQAFIAFNKMYSESKAVVDYYF